MCRRHMLSITPHKERSVGTRINSQKISVSERRDLYLGNLKQSIKINK